MRPPDLSLRRFAQAPPRRGAALLAAAAATTVCCLLGIVNVVVVAAGPCQTSDGRKSGACQAILRHHGGLLDVGVVTVIGALAALWSQRRGDWLPSAFALILMLGASVATLVAAA